MPFPTSFLVQSNRFTDVHIIGKGAAGLVYKAKDTALNRVVAVKEVLPSYHLFHEECARFEKETKIQAKMLHSHIVTAYNVEIDPQTQERYLICEYFPDGSLDTYIKKYGALSEDQAIKVTIDICTALQETWSHGIVHRDIKPSNILLILDHNGTVESAKLGDFGVAQDKDLAKTTGIHGSSHPGTQLYMAPEQSDFTRVLDVRADLYALGITLWEMLTNTDYKVQCPNGVLNLKGINPKPHPRLIKIIQKATHNDINQRYATPQEMARDLNGRKPYPWMVLLLIVVFLGGSITAIALNPSLRSALGIGQISPTTNTTPLVTEPTGLAGGVSPLDEPTVLVTNVPTPTVTETPAPTATDIPTPTITETPAPTATDIPTPTITETPAPTVTPQGYFFDSFDVTPRPEWKFLQDGLVINSASLFGSRGIIFLSTSINEYRLKLRMKGNKYRIIFRATAGKNKIDQGYTMECGRYTCYWGSLAQGESNGLSSYLIKENIFPDGDYYYDLELIVSGRNFIVKIDGEEFTTLTDESILFGEGIAIESLGSIYIDRLEILPLEE
ncbi:serine/threonine-protein kinase [Herpetosiphon geysericola]|uniref:Protein kinase domain-containing protein n=1 Tax=Herpetosiphon geysericola TaxID=70996 RepID=A0A0P6XB27_9CHLR|nr:serine/threonine-protein kinase [Herpetosiphon geysericola]KPL79944.1 hypothetical protein SE18_25470 [Herpetosiphon geysericola]